MHGEKQVFNGEEGELATKQRYQLEHRERSFGEQDGELTTSTFPFAGDRPAQAVILPIPRNRASRGL